MSTTYSVMLRVHAAQKGDVTAEVNHAVSQVRQILAVRKEFPALKQILLLVPFVADCGHTCAALRSRFSDEELRGEVTICSPCDNQNLWALNAGIALAKPEASHLIVIAATLHLFDQAFENGAKVAGVASGELRHVVLDGCISNNFAAWDVQALVAIGGFDSSIGADEIAPLVRLHRKYGPCIAPIDLGEENPLEHFASSAALGVYRRAMNDLFARHAKEFSRVDSSPMELTRAVMQDCSVCV
jgi:hypothetical protein